MATHFSILAWEIPQTRKPGRLQPKGCKELDATEQLAHTSSMFSNGGRGPWGQQYLRLTKVTMGPWEFARRTFSQAWGSDSATRWGWAAFFQLTRVGHWAPDKNNKYCLLTINEVPGFISLILTTLLLSFYRGGDRTQVRTQILVLYWLQNDIREPSLAPGIWDFLKLSTGVSLILCSHFLCPSLSLYETWPHLRPGFISSLFLRRPLLPCTWIKSSVLVFLGETLCGQPSLSSWGPCSSLQPLSAAWRLLYKSEQAGQWGPITKSWELASVAALFTSHCTTSREPQPLRVSQKCDFFSKNVIFDDYIIVHLYFCSTINLANPIVLMFHFLILP